MDIESIKIKVDTSDLSKAKSSLESVENSAKKVDKSVSGLTDSFFSLKGVIASVATTAVIGNLVKMADTFTNIESKLRLVTKSTIEFSKAQNDLFKIAQNTRTGFADTVDLYKSIAQATDNLGVSQEKLLGVVELINKAGIVGGGSKESINAALTQLSQAFSSGTLRGEELNSILEQTPRLAQAIADGLGVAKGQLKALGEQGAISSEKLFNALSSQIPSVSRDFDKMKMTIEQSLTTLDNSVLKAVGSLDKLTGASSIVAGVFRGWSLILDDVSSQLRISFGDIENITEKTELIAKRQKLVKELINVQNSNFLLFGNKEEEAKRIQDEILKIANRYGELTKETEKVNNGNQGLIDKFNTMSSSAQKVIDPIKVINQEYQKLRDEAKKAGLDTPENIAKINAKEQEEILALSKKSSAESIKLKKEELKIATDLSKEYQDLAKIGMTDYEKKLYDINLQYVEFIKKGGDVATGLALLAEGERKLNEEQAKNNIEERNKAIDAELSSSKSLFELKEKQVGLLDDENEKNRILSQLYNQRQKKEIQALYDKGEITKDFYDESLQYEDELLQKNLQRYSVTGQIIEEVGSGMKSTMMDFFDYTSAGFGNMRKMVIDVGNMIYQAIVKQMVVNPLVNAATSAVGAYFATPTATTTGGTYNGVTSTAFASAKGNVFNSPSLSEYSNSIVSKPTMFAFANGGVPNMGIMGEKNGGSPEAIIPLTRTSNGDLGVKSIGSDTQNVKVEIINQSGEQLKVSNASARNNLGEQVVSIVIDAIQNNRGNLRTMIGGAR